LLLGSPLAEVLSGLSLTSELEAALIEHAGLLGRIVSDVLAWEVGEHSQLCAGLGMLSVAEVYLEALAWATDICGALERTG